MENNFKPLCSYFTKEFFHTYVDIERKLMLDQPWYLIKEDKWRIIPNTTDSKIINSFYTQFPNGIEDTKENCLEIIKDYSNF